MSDDFSSDNGLDVNLLNKEDQFTDLSNESKNQMDKFVAALRSIDQFSKNHDNDEQDVEELL